MHEEPRQVLRRQIGFLFSRPNLLLIPAPGLFVEKPFAKEMSLAILAKHCIAIKAV
jgi:hypothetical protein